MNPQALEQHTYLPDEVDGVANVLSFIRAHEHKRGRLPSPRYFLAGPEEGDHVELPETVFRVLLQVLQSLLAGKAVTVAPQSQLLTTQQAAETLGVSRPTVVKLIEKGELPAMTPGTRRRMTTSTCCRQIPRDHRRNGRASANRVTVGGPRCGHRQRSPA